MDIPKPDLIRTTRLRAGLTKRQCIDICDLARLRSWTCYENGEHRIPAKRWQMLLDYLKSAGLPCDPG